MSDYGKIASLVSRLGGAFDRQNFDELADCWTEDAVLTFTNADGLQRETVGRSAIMAWTKQSWEGGPIAIRHFVSTPDVEIDGDQATVRYYTMYPLIGTPPRTPGLGEYLARVVRSADGRWRVAHQTLLQQSMGQGDYVR